MSRSAEVERSRGEAPEGPEAWRHARWVVLLGGALLTLFVALGLFRGAADLSADQVLAVLAHRLFGVGAEPEQTADAIVWSLRAPRVAVAALVGGCLALAGAQMQGLFRNPLASPGIVGTSTGAALGAVRWSGVAPSAGRGRGVCVP